MQIRQGKNQTMSNQHNNEKQNKASQCKTKLKVGLSHITKCTNSIEKQAKKTKPRNYEKTKTVIQRSQVPPLSINGVNKLARRSEADESKVDVANIICKYLSNDELRRHKENLKKQLQRIETMQSCKREEMRLSQEELMSSQVFMINFERVEVEGPFKELSAYESVIPEINKINEQISKLQKSINRNEMGFSVEKVILSLSHQFSRILLTNHFLISKMFNFLEQAVTQLQYQEDVCRGLREELHALTIANSQLFHETKTSSAMSLYEELHKVRTVMECHQKQNFELREEVTILSKVIEEMNIQVEKAEKKLEEKRREHRILEEETRKLRAYARELESEITHEMGLEDEVNRLIQLNEKQEIQINKWKERCFKEQHANGSHNK